MKIKFGDTAFKHFHEGKTNNWNIWDNPIETLFQAINPIFFNRSFQTFPYQIINYYHDFYNAFEKYTNIKKPAIQNIVDNPGVLPANGHDICNYVARHGLANFQIQTVMKLDGRLDYNKLVKAVRLSVDAEPVFGCRFVENDPPYWERLEDIDKTMFCFFEETDNLDVAIQRFLESSLDMDKDPMVKVKLIRSGLYDTVCIKINHACCDGAGTKEYIQLLSEIYSTIDRESGVFTPKPRIGGRKDQDKLFSALDIKNPEVRWNALKGSSRTMWTFPWKPGHTNATRFVVCRFPCGQLDVMTKYGKARGATVNDLILTAYYRAMFKISQPPYGIPMDISSTIDLRRYLPDQKTEAIRNFSGGFNTRIARVKGESFEGTLSRVMHVMNKIKNGHPGLQNAMGGERVEKMSFTQIDNYFKYASLVSEIASPYSVLCGNLCIPGLSNLGFISKSLIKFGENVVTDAYIIPPVVRAPGLLLLVCTYNNILTLAAGFYKATISRTDVERLLNKIKDELAGGCK